MCLCSGFSLCPRCALGLLLVCFSYFSGLHSLCWQLCLLCVVACAVLGLRSVCCVLVVLCSSRSSPVVFLASGFTVPRACPGFGAFDLHFRVFLNVLLRGFAHRRCGGRFVSHCVSWVSVLHYSVFYRTLFR